MTSPLFSAVTLTLFPDMFPGPLGYSLAGKALVRGLWSLEAIDLRLFATDKHATVDDRPYGGGTGMVLKPDVVHAAIEHGKSLLSNATVIYTSPRGQLLEQKLVNQLISKPLIILCGRFEGVDQRVLDHHEVLEISLGDFVLSGGEIAALALLDACVRLLPGVIGNEAALTDESFSQASEYAGLLEYPHYTRPSDWNGLAVPEALLSGNHEQIRRWRLAQARLVTQARRPELMAELDKEKHKE